MGVDTTVKGVLTTNTVLSGTMTTPDGVSLGEGDRCLVTAQNDPLYNGVYYVHSTAWTFDTEFHLYPAVSARIFAGNVYKHSEWILDASADVIPGVGVQNWVLDRMKGTGVPGDGMTRDAVTGHLELANTGVTPGTYQNPNILINTEGRITSANSSNIIRTYQEGLEVQYINTTTIQVRLGAAYVPGLNKIVERTATSSFNPTLTPSTDMYVYLYEVNGTGQIEFSTTPAVQYLGNAYQKSGDSTRRYIGYFFVGAGGTIDSTTVESSGYASSTLPGIVELATAGEGHLGTDAQRAMTPYTLAQRQLMPIGSILMWGGLRAGTPPARWNRCLGQSALRTDFPELFALIGTTYGQGDTPGTTFAFPDLTARFPLGASAARDSGNVGGAETHTLTAAEMAPHTHTYSRGGGQQNDISPSGGRSLADTTAGTTGNGSGSLLGNAHNNMPPYQTLMFIIRSLP